MFNEDRLERWYMAGDLMCKNLKMPVGESAEGKLPNHGWELEALKHEVPVFLSTK